MVLINKKEFTLKKKKWYKFVSLLVKNNKRQIETPEADSKNEQVVVQIELLKPKDQCVSDSIVNYSERESDSDSDSLT